MSDLNAQSIEHIIDGCQCEGKQCTGCKETQCIYAFDSAGKRQGARRARCKVCCKMYAQQYRTSEQGKEHIIAAYRKRDYSQTAPTHGQKRCFRCGVTKDYSEFNKDKSRPDGRCPECVECKNKRLKLYQQTRKPSPEELHRRSFRFIKDKMNLSLDDMEALYTEAFALQKGVCAICGKPETAKFGETTKRLAIDHCHVTGKFRGLLCFNCNAALGKFNDDPELLQKAIVYLQQ